MTFQIFQSSGVSQQAEVIYQVNHNQILLSPFHKGENYNLEGRLSDLLWVIQHGNTI